MRIRAMHLLPALLCVGCLHVHIHTPDPVECPLDYQQILVTQAVLKNLDNVTLGKSELSREYAVGRAEVLQESHVKARQAGLPDQIIGNLGTMRSMAFVQADELRLVEAARRILDECERAEASEVARADSTLFLQLHSTRSLLTSLTDSCTRKSNRATLTFLDARSAALHLELKLASLALDTHRYAQSLSSACASASRIDAKDTQSTVSARRTAARSASD
jgi:hypothetical protein